MIKLTNDVIVEKLADLPGWSLNQDSLHKEFEFKDFNEAFSFMVSLAFEAEKLNHHPDWSNSYNKVVIDLVSHDENGITENDVKLAEKANKIAQRFL